MNLNIRSSWFLGMAFMAFIIIAAGQGQSEAEKGTELVDRYCASCHVVEGWVHSKEEWEYIVPDMAARGGDYPSDSDTASMVDYLARHFGTGGAAPAGNQSAADDGKGQKLLEGACLPCHEASGWMRSRDEWEVIAPDHAARGGVALSEADMKVLVDYLTRHYGP
jgi:cytochrome c2